jgi:hypothetical protein
MKRCAQCHGKLGLGVRSRNLWKAAGGFTFAIVRPTARFLMRWSDGNAKYRWYTPFSLAAVRRAE